MENQQFDVTTCSDHELIVGSNFFKEHKEHSKILVDGHVKEELIHKRQIGKSYYEVHIDLIDGELSDNSAKIKTNLEDEEKIAEFKSQWEAEFKPSIGQPNKALIAIFKKFAFEMSGE